MNRKIFSSFATLAACCIMGLYLTSCGGGKDSTKEQETQEASALPEIQTANFGTLPNGKLVKSYTLKNANGMEMTVINYGGIITSLTAPDKEGTLGDVVLGFDSLSGYLGGSPYFGALIGRYGNRIAKGKFSIDGKEYSIPTNNAPNTLHGGDVGFDKVYWEISPADPAQGKNALTLTYTSPDGDQGYPGNLTCKVVYTLTDDNEVKIDYTATTDKKTVVNLTQHTYFNLTGSPANDILSHELMIDAEKFLPVDNTLIPTGELKPVAGTPFDFNEMTPIGARIDQKNQQLDYGKGYDHCWVLDHNMGTLDKVAALYDPASGRYMEIMTTEPGLQFYSGNFLDGTLIGKGGIPCEFRHAVALETQHFPDSPNKPEFPSVELNPGDTYTTTTIYKFSTK